MPLWAWLSEYFSDPSFAEGLGQCGAEFLVLHLQAADARGGGFQASQ